MIDDTTGLNIQIQASKTYLVLSMMVYLLCVFCAWYYFYSLGLSVSISIGLSIWLYHYLPKRVLLAGADAINNISLNEGYILVKKNDQSSTQYSWFYPTYQSRFLVIIALKRQSLVIFKDSVVPQSLSMLNRFLNAQR